MASWVVWLLLLAADIGRPLRPFDPMRCALLKRIPLDKGTCYALAISPDGRRMAVGCSDGTTVVLACRGGEILYRLDSHPGGVYGVGFSPDSRTLASAGARDGKVRLWDVETGEASRAIQTGQGVHYRLAFHPGGGKLLAASQGDAAQVWDLQDGLRKASLPGHNNLSYACCFRGDGRQAATSDTGGTLRLWRTDTWERVREIQGAGGTVYALTYARDGRRLVSGGSNGELSIWDAASGERWKSLSGHTGEVRGAAFTLDGRVVISAADATLRFWDVEQGIELRRLAQTDGTAFEVAVHPSGAWFALTGSGGAVCIYGRE